MHHHRCKLCGRSWECRGECSVVEFLRCLACGATVDDCDRAPDGIDVKPNDAAAKDSTK